jgi:hypothetical protein
MRPRSHAKKRAKIAPQTYRKPKLDLQRRFTKPQPHVLFFLHGLPPEVRLQIWKYLLVSTKIVTPRYRICNNCVGKTDNERRAAQHTYECIWDPRLSLDLYPNILQTCRLFYEEGVYLLYTKNNFTNLCQKADETAAYFFQRIGEDNARRIQNYTLSWPYITSSPALIYLSVLPSLQYLSIEGFDNHKATKANLRWLSRIRAKSIQWQTLHEETKEEYSGIITGRIAKRKENFSWADAVST